MSAIEDNLRARVFADSVELAAALAHSVADDVRRAVAERGSATLVVSGGTTPKQFLVALGQQNLEWSRVTVTLADERWVPPTHPRSNARMLRETLLRGSAAAAHFISLYADTPDPESGLAEIMRRVEALSLPFDAVVLGLGNDGHCASLFPDGDHYMQATDPAASTRVLPMRSATAGEPRTTLTLPALVSTRALYLHIEGADKQQTLARVRAGEGALAASPLRTILRVSAVPLNVFTCA